MEDFLMELPEGPPMAGIHSEDTSTNSFVKIAPHTQVKCVLHTLFWHLITQQLMSMCSRVFNNPGQDYMSVSEFFHNIIFKSDKSIHKRYFLKIILKVAEHVLK